MQRLFMESMLGLSANQENCSWQFWPNDNTAIKIEKVGYKDCRRFKAPDLNSVSKSNMEEIDFINLQKNECDSPNMLGIIIPQNDIENRLEQTKKQSSTPREQKFNTERSFKVENVYFYDTEYFDEDIEFGEFESKTDLVGSVTGSSSKSHGFLTQMFHSLSETDGLLSWQTSNNAISVPIPDKDSKPFDILSDRCDETNVPIMPIHNLETSYCIEDILKNKRGLLDSNVRAHYNVLQRRLRCGSHLETQRKEMKRRENNSKLKNSTTKKYNTFLEEYLNLCHQESVILDQIASLQAEISVWQKKDRQKKAVLIKSILLEPGSPQYSSLKVNNERLNKNYQRKQGLLFPPLPPPKPLVLSMCKSKYSKNESKSGVKANMNHRFQLSNPEKLVTFDNIPPTCTVYPFYNLLEPPRQPKRPTPAIRCDGEEKIKHRLQKFQGLLEPELQYNKRERLHYKEINEEVMF